MKQIIFFFILFLNIGIFSQNISINSKGTLLPQAILLLAEQHGVNIILSPDIPSVPLNLTLKDIPFEQALDLICKVSGLHWNKTDNTCIVYPPSGKYTEYNSSIVKYRFKNIHPKYIVDSISKLFKKYTFSVSEHTPDLFIRGYFGMNTENNLLKIAESLDYQRTIVNSVLTFKAKNYQESSLYEINTNDHGSNKANFNLNVKNTDSNSNNVKSASLTSAIGEKGSIFIGEEIFFGQSVDNPPISKKIGIDIKITPISISSDNNVTINIEFSSSRLIGIIDGFPQIGQESFNTEIIVPAGVDYPVGIYDQNRSNSEFNSIPLPDISIFSKRLLQNGINGMTLTINCSIM